MLKSILQTCLFLTFFTASSLYANEYRDIITVKLKKDEHKKMLVKYDKNEKLFKFRWTLYVNSGLVLLKSFDKIVSQHILYDKYKSRSFRMELMTRGGQRYKVPYLLVKFVKFDYTKNEAEFQLFLSDPNSKITLEYLDQKS